MDDAKIFRKLIHLNAIDQRDILDFEGQIEKQFFFRNEEPMIEKRITGQSLEIRIVFLIMFTVLKYRRLVQHPN